MKAKAKTKAKSKAQSNSNSSLSSSSRDSSNQTITSDKGIEYVIGPLLGRGGEGSVYVAKLADDKSSKYPLVAKIGLEKSSLQMEKRLLTKFKNRVAPFAPKYVDFGTLDWKNVLIYWRYGQSLQTVMEKQCASLVT